MNKFLTIFSTVLPTLLLASCGESFQERCRREAQEYTLRQCPHQANEILFEDSMVYVDEPAGFAYYNTLTERADTAIVFNEEILSNLQQSLLTAIKGSIAMKSYKEHGLSFTFIVRSPSTKKTVFSFTFTPDDY